MKKVLSVIALIFVVAGAYGITQYANEEKYYSLRATFRMAGIEYKGYELRDGTLVFKFERKGDVFAQVIVSKEYTTNEKIPVKDVKKVIMELTTNGTKKVYEAKFVGDEGEKMIYEATEK
ncbi:hypothetical protein [Thermococcus sp. 101 C5]|uniref:hypothetical protein n=1 Tax=Thermococcus sp. 101 C5 TaxID=2654197 RepID=UPI0020A646BA|nr:hypothetical protein [Thermococcus sp. 101 C5]